MNKIFLDMDGVMCDFDGYTLARIGKRLREFPDSQSGWDAIAHISHDMFLHFDPMPDADELVYTVLELAEEYEFGVGVLTAVPKLLRVPLAEQHKREWLAKRYPMLLEDFRIGPQAVDKQNHCKPGYVLIDDSHLNIPQWTAKGGCGILHTSAKQSISELRQFLDTTAEIRTRLGG